MLQYAFKDSQDTAVCKAAIEKSPQGLDLSSIQLAAICGDGNINVSVYTPGHTGPQQKMSPTYWLFDSHMAVGKITQSHMCSPNSTHHATPGKSTPTCFIFEFYTRHD